jgi:hypothetical protein
MRMEQRVRPIRHEVVKELAGRTPSEAKMEVDAPSPTPTAVSADSIYT